MGSNPWAKCDNPCIPVMSLLVGGQIKEVAVMNQLSSNLHFMMVCINEEILFNSYCFDIICRQHFIDLKVIVIKSYMKNMHFQVINMQLIHKLKCVVMIQMMRKLLLKHEKYDRDLM